MTKFIVKYDNNQCSYFELSGHSGYDNVGKDIVCSAITTAAYTTINLLNRLFKDNYKLVDGKSGYLHVDITYQSLNEEESILIQEIIKNLIDIMENISSQYPKNLKINVL